MQKQLIEGEDFYYNDEGKMVMTAQYHIHRGYCCGNGCKHCPYDYINVLAFKLTILQQENILNEEKN